MGLKDSNVLLAGGFAKVKAGIHKLTGEKVISAGSHCIICVYTRMDISLRRMLVFVE